MPESITRRNLFKRELNPLRRAVELAIAKADPIKLLALGAPGDEYQPEVDGIMRCLPSAVSRENVRAIIHQEFEARFGADLAGIPEAYDEPAARIWDAMQHARAK